MERLITRRELLRSAATNSVKGLAALSAVGIVLTDTFLSHRPEGGSISIGFFERLETGTLGVSPEEWKKKVEAELRLKLVSPSAGVPYVTYDQYGHEMTLATLEWDSPRLVVLYEILRELPEHFYKPRQVAGGSPSPLQVALLAPESELDISFCDCYNPIESLVAIHKEMLVPTIFGREYSKRNVTHEFTHAVTTPNIRAYIDVVCKPIGINTYADLWRTFGSEIEAPSLDYLLNMREVIEGYRRVGVDFPPPPILPKSRIGYGATDFHEFFAVAAEFYIKGWKIFIETYEKFLGKENVLKLYEKMRDSIFLGKEY